MVLVVDLATRFLFLRYICRLLRLAGDDNEGEMLLYSGSVKDGAGAAKTFGKRPTFPCGLRPFEKVISLYHCGGITEQKVEKNFHHGCPISQRDFKSFHLLPSKKLHTFHQPSSYEPSFSMISIRSPAENGRSSSSSATKSCSAVTISGITSRGVSRLQLVVS